MELIFTLKKMKQYCILFLAIEFLVLLTCTGFAQTRIYASEQTTGVTGICAGCIVNNPANAVNTNRSDYATLNITLGLLIPPATYQTLIFSGTNKPAAGTPVIVKIGTADQLLSLDLLGGITLQAFNGSLPIGQPVAASTLVSVLSSNNQIEATLIPNTIYDRVRITLSGGLVSTLSNANVYGAYFNSTNTTVACDAAIDELNGISSGLLGLGLNLGGVVNPQLAIDGNLATASTLNAGVAAAGAFAQQTIVFSGPSVLGDSVRLTLSLPQTLLDAGILSSVQVSTSNGTTDNTDSRSLTSSLLNVRLLDLNAGNRTVAVTFAPSKTFDRVQVRLGGGLLNALSTLNIYEAQRLIPRPVVSINGVVANSTTACIGSSVLLSATATANTVFNWYTSATGGTPVFTGNSFQTPALASTATYYAEAVRNGCTNASERAPVIINIIPAPAAPVVTNNTVTVCSGGNASFTAQNMAGVTVNWFAAATGGTPIFTGNVFTTPALTSTTKYYAEATVNGTCTSAARTEVTATVSDLPANPTPANANVTVCSGTPAVLSVLQPSPGVLYNWYTSVSGGTPVYTGTNFTTPILSANTNFYLEAVNANGCASAQRVLVSVAVTPKPANPVVAVNNSNINAGQTATLSVTNAQTGVTYNWYASATGSTPVFSGTTFQTPALYTTTSYYVEAVSSGGCISANRTQATVTVNNNILAPCSFANQQATDVNGICIGCLVTNPNLAIDADTTTASTISVLAGLTGGNASQTLTFQQAGFAGDTIKVVVQSPTGLADVNLLSSIQVEVLNNGTIVNTYPLDNAAIKVRLLGANGRYAILIPATGTYNGVRVRLNSGIVSAATSLQVYYAAQLFPKLIFAVTNPEICKNTTAQINITSPATGTFNWFTTPTGGNAVFTGTNFTTPALTASTTYYVEYTRNGCTAALRYPVTVLVNDVPLKPTAAFANVTICANESITLTATTAGNATVKWYDAATNGTLLFTGNNFTTPVLTASTIYYAETGLGSCTSADRTPITVNVNPAPANFAVTPLIQAVNAGSTATFTATSSDTNTVFNWYNSATGGTVFYTGATYTSPTLYANTTYYAEAVSANGCRSANRIAVTATVNQLITNAVPCDAAVDQTTAVNGLVCVNCSVANAAAATDQNSNSFSQLNVTAGLVNAYAAQTLRFANTGSAGDSIVVDLGLPVNLADLNVLSQIQLATYNGTTYNNDRFNVNSSLVNVRVLADQSRFRIAFKASSNFDRVEVRLNSTAAGVLSALKIFDAAQEVAAPVVTVSGAGSCFGTQTTLTATVPNNVTVNWYSSATGGSPLYTGLVFTTPALTSTTTYYAEAVRTTSGCVQIIRTPVTVIIIPQPAVPVVTADQVTVCPGQTASFTAQNIAGVTHNWYTAATGGTLIFSGDTFVSDPLTVTTDFYVEAVVNGQCTSAVRKKVTATVNNTVTDPVVAQTAVQTCSGSSVTLSASSSQTGVTFQWFDSATATTPIFTGSNFVTPALTASQTYYVQAVNGTCVSNKVAVTVTVNPAPDVPAVTVNPANGQVAAGQTAALTASSAAPGVTYKWYTQAQGGSVIFEGSTFTTPALSSTTTYYVEAVSASGCPSISRTSVTISVNPVFSTTCDFAATQNNAVNNLCIGCTVTTPENAVDADLNSFARYNIPVGLSGANISQQLIFTDQGVAGDTVQVLVRIPNTTFSTQLLSGLTLTSYNGTTPNNDQAAVGSNFVSVVILNGGERALLKFAPQAAFDRVQLVLNSGGASSSNSLDVFYATKQVALPLLTQNNVPVCAGGQATFTVANPRAGTNYDWFDTASAGNLLFTGTSFTTPILTATTTYYVQSKRTSTGCINPTRVAATAVITTIPPTPVLAQTAFNICAGETVNLAVNNPGSATIKWYDAATAGNLLFTGSTWQTPAIFTSTHFYVEASAGSCTNAARTDVTVTVNPRPATPTFVADQVTVCTGNSATLEISNPETNVSYDWFTTPTGGNAVFTGVKFVTPALLINTTYYVQAISTGGNCINNGVRAAATVSVTPGITAPVLSASATSVCSGGSVTVAVTSPAAGLIYNTYNTALGGTPVFSGTSFTLTNLTAGVTYYTEASNGMGCISTARTPVTITIIPAPDRPAVQSGGLMICAGNTTTLKISNPQPNLIYRWYSSATASDPIFTGNEFTTPALTANTIYYVDASSSQSCNPSARQTVNVAVSPVPDAPVLSAETVTVCAGKKATFTVAAPVAGITYRWFDSPAKTNKLFEGSTFVSNALPTSTDFYIDAISASGCSSSALAIAHAVVAPTPSAPLLVNASVSVCSGSQATLVISNPQIGLTYNWFDAAAGGNLAFTGTSFTTPAITTNTNFYAEATRNGDCTSTSRTTASINVNPAPDAATVATAGTTVCSGSSTTLTAGSTTPNASFNWYLSATGGTAIFSGSSYTTPVLTASTTYYVETVSSLGCTATTRTVVNVTVGNGTAPAPQVAPGGLAVCQNSSAVIRILNPDVNTTYNWYNAAADTNPIFTGSQFTTPVLSAGTTYYVRASSANYCTPSAALAVTVSVSIAPKMPVADAATVTVCTGGKATLSVASPESGVTYNWYDSPSKTNKLFTGNIFVTGSVLTDTNFYIEAAGNTGCTNPNLALVQVKTVPAPAAPTVASNNVSGCPGDQFTLTVANPQPDLTYNWYSSASGGSSLFTGNSFVTPQLTANTAYYAETLRGSDCASASRTAVNINLNAAPSAPVVAAQGTAICAGSSTVLTATADAGAIVKWYATATGGTELYTGTSFVTPVLDAATTYYVAAISSATNCASVSRTPVTVNVAVKLAAPVVSVKSTTTSSVTFGWAAVNGATGYEISMDNGDSFISPGAGSNILSYTVTGMQPGQNATIIVRAKGASDCQLSANSNAVTGTAANPAGNLVWVPNAFTPNGDGNNDVLYVYGNAIKQLSFNVYSQWGELIFNSTTKNTGWDGTFKNTLEPVGVYVYYLEVVTNDGQIVKMKGTINLIR